MRTVSAIGPLPGGRDLPCVRFERLPELHSYRAAGGIAGQFMGASYTSRYLWVIFAFQVLAGLLLLVNRYVPLAVAVLAPVIVNILSFHALMASSGLQLALVTGVTGNQGGAATEALQGMIQQRPGNEMPSATFAVFMQGELAC